MPADVKKVEKLESQPIRPIEMPEYRYQDYVTTEHNSTSKQSKPRRDEKIDLRGVALNLS